MTVNAHPWSLAAEDIGNGRRCRISDTGRFVSFDELLTLLAENPTFVDWYSNALANCRYEAVFWEHPALTEQSINGTAEFVLLDAPLLATVSADPRPFANVFAQPDSIGPVSFASLGKDALLVAPGPGIGLKAGAHLLAFLRNASGPQIRSLWHVVATATRARLSDVPLWLSTSGLGVYWLHVRLDSRPKYYQHRPYRDADYLAGC